MKNILLLLILFSFGNIAAQEINWMTMNEALAAQKKNPKKIFYGCVHHVVRSLQNAR